jgi:hypothetical protein
MSSVGGRTLVAAVAVVALGAVVWASQPATQAQAAARPGTRALGTRALGTRTARVKPAKTTPVTTPTFPATGFFHTGEANGHWYLVTPQGQPFYADGVSHVSIQGDVDQTNGTCPYCQAVSADYSSTAQWDSTQITRLRSWGFDSLGPFSDDSALGSQIPYTVQLDMASGDDWFAPSFVTNADAVAQADAAPLKNDPNLIGYFTDSELSWSPPDAYGLGTELDNYLALPTGSPGLAVAQQYIGNPNGFLYALATRYFSVTAAALKAADPNHLNLGAKAEGQEIEPVVLEAAAPYVDVFSLEDYQLMNGFEQQITNIWPTYLPVQPNLADMEAYVNKPLLIGEYTELGADTPDANTDPGIYAVFPTQAARAQAYENFIAPLYEDAPWVVGDEWFEYIDEPAGGRVGNGENNNFGLLNVGDQPYAPMVAAMSAMHSIDPQAQVTTGATCDSWADSGSGVVCTATLPHVTYPVSVATTTLAGATQGTAYDQYVFPGGGVSPYTWSVTGGALPKGLKLNKKTGEITGTPKTPGTSSFTATVVDAKGTTASGAESISVGPDTPASVKTTSIPKATEGKAYAKVLVATGGTPPYTWTVTGGALPAGLSLTTGGELLGTPIVSGTFSFTVTATDSTSPTTSGSRTFTLPVKA